MYGHALTLLFSLAALTMTHRRRQSEKAQEAMAEALSTLELGMPERVARANARADGAKTPVPPCVLLHTPMTVLFPWF